MPTKQQDRLKKLLGLTAKKVPDMVRLREMNDVRNYNRNQQAKVFENEKRQVARYADTNAPESAKDVGSAFKLQVYTLKLNGLLQAKQDAVQQVELVIGTENSKTDAAGQPIISLGASQLRQANLAPYVNTIFGKAEVIQTFNEMMAFIKTYMGDIFSNDRIRDIAYTSYLTPLSQNLVATANEYPDLFGSLQVRRGNAADPDRAAKAVFREQSIQVFSLLMAMAENINIQALRPIKADDIERYAKTNGVEQIITTRGKAVVPYIPSLPPGQPILPVPTQETPTPLTPEQQQAQIAAQQQQQQPPPQPQPQAPQGPSLDDVIERFRQANPEGVDPTRIFVKGAYGTEADMFRAIREYADSIGYDAQSITNTALKAAIKRNKAGQGASPAPPPQPQPVSPQQGPASPPQQGQQAGPAPVDIRLQQQLSPGGQDVTDGDNVRQALQAQGTDIPDRFRSVTDRMVSRIKGAETTRGGIFRARSDADVDEIWNSLANSSLGAELDQLMADEGGQKMFIRDIMKGMMLVRKARADQLAGQQDSGRQNELYGFGKKSNAKVFLRGCGVPEDIIGTSFMRHGLNDASTIDELEGSGIMDTLKNFAGSVADSASGWFDTIKANMPTMSDVRRAVAKVVPDSMSDYVPSGLKRTFGDKAKDFFGFGMSGGEFHGDPRAQHARHREPFENFFDERGFRQGAVHRMTTMFVPDYEVTSGLNRLKGGDQLSDHDPEVLRRQDHHDVSLYQPAVIQQPIHGYGRDGDEDDVMEGGLAQRLRKPMPTDVISKPYGKMPMFVHRVEDHDDYMPADNVGSELAHYMELEKPADMDEDPNPFRIRNENYKVNTGKLKKVTYHTS